MTPPCPALILASQSKGRCEMLRGAGLAFEAIPAHIDERALTQDLTAIAAQSDEISVRLAAGKALALSAKHPDALVIGSDQILTFDGQILHKAGAAQEAINRLKAMQGREHYLTSAVVVARGNKVLWQHSDSAYLQMGFFDDHFWQRYQARAGAALTQAAGGYWLEDVGSWLFDEIRGQYFTILGMPLLPLLHYLRTQHNIMMEGA